MPAPPTGPDATPADFLEVADEWNRAGDLEGTLRITNQALSRWPNSVEVIIYRSQVRSQSSDHAGAISDCDRAVELESSARTLSARGWRKFVARRTEEAFEDFDRACTLDPSSGDAFHGRACMRQWLNDEPGALADFQVACRLWPRWSEGRISAGLIAAGLGRHEDAVRALKEAFRLNPAAVGADTARSQLAASEAELAAQRSGRGK